MKFLPVIVGAFASATSFAIPSLELLKKGVEKPDDRPLSHLSCTDFSGDWRGTCIDDDGATSDTELKITQIQCDSIVIDGLRMPIGGSRTLIVEGKGDSEVLILYPSWDTSRRGIDLTGSVTMRYSTGSTVVGKYIGTLRIQDSMLVTTDSLESEVIGEQKKQHRLVLAT